MGDLAVHFRLFLFSPIFALAAGCGGPDEPPPALPGPVRPVQPMEERPPEELPPPRTLQERLTQGVQLVLDQGSPAFEILVAASGAEPQLATAPVAVAGLAAASLDDRRRIVFNEVVLDIADLEISPEAFPPYGAHLSEVRVRVARAALRPEWNGDGTAATFSGSTTLRVDWTLIGQSGNRIPLRPIEADVVTLEGALRDDARGLAISLSASAPGRLLHVADLIDLSDLSFQLVLIEPSTSPDAR